MILVLAYLLCVPLDHILLPLIHGPANSYLSGRTVLVDFGISIGQLVRPAMLLAMLVGLIILNTTDLIGRSLGAVRV